MSDSLNPGRLPATVRDGFGSPSSSNSKSRSVTSGKIAERIFGRARSARPFRGTHRRTYKSTNTRVSLSLSAARSATQPHISHHTVESKETRKCSHQEKIAPLYPLNAHTIPPVVCPLAQLDPEAALRLLPQRLLHLVHLLIRQRAVHRPIGYPVAMARLALLRVGELVD